MDRVCFVLAPSVHPQSSDSQTKMAGVMGVEKWLLLLIIDWATGGGWRHTIVPRRSSDSSESLLRSAGGVTSKPMLPLSGILMLPRIPPPNKLPTVGSRFRLTSSTLDVLRATRPCRKELERLIRMSSTRSEWDRPRLAPKADGGPKEMSGLSGKESEFAFCGIGLALLRRRRSSQMLMCDRRRLLWRSKVFCAENGLGRIR